jgi:hypothetical protein
MSREFFVLVEKRAKLHSRNDLEQFQAAAAWDLGRSLARRLCSLVKRALSRSVFSCQTLGIAL